VDRLPRAPVLVSAFLANDAASLLTRLKCASRDIERGRAVRDWRDRYPDPRQPVAVRRWLSETAEHAGDLLALIPALAPGAGEGRLGRLADAVEQVRAAGDPLTLQALAVDGNDLIAAGVRAGPDVGEALRRLFAEVIEDPRRNTREYLLSRV